jgi:hypothetical protein
MSNQAEKEKIREFCYELALALRRITGRVVADSVQNLAEDLGEKGQQSDSEKDNSVSGFEQSN